MLLTLLATPVLIAQAPAPAAVPFNALQIFQKDVPQVEAMLQNLQYPEALAKIESLLPATVEPFDKSSYGASYNSYLRLWATSRIYAAAGRAAQACANYEKSLTYFKRAVEIGKQNGTDTEAALTEAIKGYQQDIQVKKGQLEGNADYIKDLKSKANPTADDKQQLATVKGWEDGIAENEKWMGNFEKAIKHAKADVESIAPAVTVVENLIKQEAESLENYTFKNNKVKYVDGTVSNKGYLEKLKAQLGKGDQLTFFYRLAVLDPENKKVQREINVLLGKAAPAAEPAPKKGKK